MGSWRKNCKLQQLKVEQLKKELEKLGLATIDNKADLQLRFRSVLESNRQNEEETGFADEASVDVVKAIEPFESKKAVMRMMQQLMLQNREAQKEAMDRAEQAHKETIEKVQQAQGRVDLAQKEIIESTKDLPPPWIIGSWDLP